MEINIGLFILCILMLLIGLLGANELLTGGGFLGAIFFCTYSIYAYVRRSR